MSILTSDLLLRIRRGERIRSTASEKLLWAQAEGAGPLGLAVQQRKTELRHLWSVEADSFAAELYVGVRFPEEAGRFAIPAPVFA